MNESLYYIYKHNNCDDMQYWDVHQQRWTLDYSEVAHIELWAAQSIANILILEEKYHLCIGKILPDMKPDPYFLGILVDSK